MSATAARRDFWRKCLELLASRVGYVWGGRDEHGVDCSGFVAHALLKAGGPDLRGYNTDSLWTKLPRVTEADLLPGDLVLYFGEKSTGPDDVGHVMVYGGFGLVFGMAWGGPSDTDGTTSRLGGKVPLVREMRYRSDLAGFVRLPIA